MTNVFIAGYYGFLNAGDDAMLYGLLMGMRHKTIDRCYVLSDCLDLKIPNGINVVYIPTNNADLQYMALRDSNIIGIGGGVHVRGWGKNWFTQSMRIMSLAMSARFMDKKWRQWNVAFETGNNGCARAIEWYTKRVGKTSVRDVQTVDSAVLLPTSPKHGKIIGINLTPVNKLFRNDYASDLKLADWVGRTVLNWLDKNPGWKVRYYAFNTNEKYTDVPINAHLMNQLGHGTMCKYDGNIIDFVNDIGFCSMFIGMRYHAGILSYINEIPCAVIDTYPNSMAMANRFGHKFVTVNHLGPEILYCFLDCHKQYKSTLEIDKAKELALKGIVL